MNFSLLAQTASRRLPILGTMLVTTALLAGCAGNPPDQTKLFDLGPVRTQAEQTTTLPALSVADVQAPAWLDSQMMFYRLAYANDQQPRPYAANRWTMPPAQLFAERLKSSLSRAGGTVVAASDGAINVPILRLEVDEFLQTFSSASNSVGRVAIRASIYEGRALRTQKLFLKEVPANSADAQGGAAALTAASDAVIQDMRTWLATLPAKR